MGGAVNGNPDHNEAQGMLGLCASVGATAVDLTLTNSAGEKEWFRRNLALTELGRMLPSMLDDATARKRNVIIRPHGPGVTFLQLDDLKAHQLPAVAFVEIETSPGNYQAWLALSGTHDREFCSRVRNYSTPCQNSLPTPKRSLPVWQAARSSRSERSQKVITTSELTSTDRGRHRACSHRPHH